MPMAIDTATNVSALAEHRLGAGQGARNMLYLTVGSGIGGGILIDGKPVHGLVHPELGHMLLAPQEGDPMPDGVCPFHRHCLEGLASGPAMEKRWGLPAKLMTDDHPAWALEAQYLAQMCANMIVTISPEKGIVSDKSHCISEKEHARCVFEYIYFARPDSYIDGVSVYNSRMLAGKYLAIDSPVDADLVVGVPESGNVAALGYSLQSGIPYGQAFVKNSYVGRTFIKPKQQNRDSSVQVKLNVLKEAVKGKRIIMIDDSIVRGTTSDRIVGMLRNAGAKEVHMRVSSPPFLWPCYFGTDVPAREQLIAYNRSVEQIRDIIGSDSLAYLKLERLKELSGGLGVCEGCFTGKYPLDPPDEDIRGEFEQ